VILAEPGGSPGAVGPARVALLGLLGLAWSLLGSTGYLAHEFAGPLIEAVGKAAAEAAASGGGVPELLSLLQWVWARCLLLGALIGGQLEYWLRTGREFGRTLLHCYREGRERRLTAVVHRGQVVREDTMWQQTVGKFVAVSRNTEWDEFYVGAVHTGEETRLVCLTTTADGDEFQWVAVKAVEDLVKPLESTTSRRREPEGVEGGQLNWICCPPEGYPRWSPTGAEAVTLRAAAIQLLPQAAALPAHLVAAPGAPLGEFARFARATEIGPRLPFPAPGEQAVVRGQDPPPQEARAAAPVGAGAIGFPGAGGGHGMANMDEMMREIDSIRNAVNAYQQDERRRHPKEKKKKKRRKSSSRTSRKHRRRHRSNKKRNRKKSRGRHGRRHRSTSSRSASSSASSSSSCSSRSGSRSSRSRSRGSSRSQGVRLLRWKPNAKKRDREVQPESVRELETRKWRARGDLLSFAARHPGALSGYFLAMVHQKLSHGMVRRRSDLNRVSVSQWASQYSGLSEMRDLREVQTIAAAMDLINMGTLAECMDTLAQRIVAIQQAKKKGGSWEKAESIELVTGPSSGAAASGLLRLTA